MITLAINGYGRIGRSVLRALYEGSYQHSMQIVAINEPADGQTIAHLSRYDSTHGRFNGEVELLSNDTLAVNGQKIAITHHKKVADIAWPNVDVVLECSGR